MNILVLNGPNLNLLGERESSLYGAMTLAQLVKKVTAHARGRAKVRARQSNSDAHRYPPFAPEVGRRIDSTPAPTPTTYALRDAVAAIRVPTIEVHLSDVTRRAVPPRSVIEPVCAGRRFGKGLQSYFEAIDVLVSLNRHSSSRPNPSPAEAATGQEYKIQSDPIPWKVLIHCSRASERRRPGGSFRFGAPCRDKAVRGGPASSNIRTFAARPAISADGADSSIREISLDEDFTEKMERLYAGAVESSSQSGDRKRLAFRSPAPAFGEYPPQA